MGNSQEAVLRQLDQLGEVAPSEVSTRRALAKARRALLDPQSEYEVVQARPGPRHLPWKFALAGCMAVVTVTAACFVFLYRDSVAFAEVQHEMRKMRTVSYNFVSGDADQRIVSRHVVSGTRVRKEGPGHMRIFLPDQQTVLHINHDDKTALFSRDNSNDDRKAIDVYHRLATIVDASAKRIGKRTIAGKPAIGFEVPETGNGAPMRVWVDPRTRLPVRIEAAGNRVLQDFEFNMDVPEDLFKLTVPEGYFVENRYETLQAPLALEKSEMQTYMSLVTRDDRSPQETVEAFLKLAAAGKTALIRGLQRRPASDDIRELDGFQDLRLKEMLATDTAALGVTGAAVKYRGKRRAMVFTLQRFDGVWLIDDIDLETAEGVEKEISQFRAANPDAKKVE